VSTAIERATKSGRGLTTRLHFWLAKAYRGAGRPATKAVLDMQYQSGGWRRLDTLEQMLPCMIVAGYVHHLGREPRVLDVGCGHGRLAALLSRFPIESYVGIDLSSEAISQARGAAIAGAEFVTADFDQWRPAGKFDVIVFLDSLYYAEDPLATLNRYSNALDADGHLIVSMYRYSNNALIQRRLARHFDELDRTTVRNHGKRWDIQILRPSAEIG
jgi:SAM-dependent methyltransferase